MGWKHTQWHLRRYNIAPTSSGTLAGLGLRNMDILGAHEQHDAPATSQIFIVTFPFLIFLKLNATVGTTSSLHWTRGSSSCAYMPMIRNPLGQM